MNERQQWELPPNWNEWPESQKIDYVDMTSTRKGLLEEISRHCGADLQTDPTARMNKWDLSGIVVALRESEGGNP